MTQWAGPPRSRQKVDNSTWNIYPLGHLAFYRGPGPEFVCAVTARGRRYRRVWWRIYVVQR